MQMQHVDKHVPYGHKNTSCVKWLTIAIYGLVLFYMKSMNPSNERDWSTFCDILIISITNPLGSDFKWREINLFSWVWDATIHNWGYYSFHGCFSVWRTWLWKQSFKKEVMIMVDDFLHFFYFSVGLEIEWFYWSIHVYYWWHWCTVFFNPKMVFWIALTMKSITIRYFTLIDMTNK